MAKRGVRHVHGDAVHRCVSSRVATVGRFLTVKDGKLAPVERVYSDAKMKVFNQEHGVIGYLDQ